MKSSIKKCKLKMLAAILLLVMTCTSCGKEKAPLQTADGQAWDSSWATVASTLGVELPKGYSEIRNEGVVTTAQTYYVVWAKGDEIKYKNHEDTEVSTYDAQIHLLTEEAKSEDVAAEDAAMWDSITAERYPDMESYTADFAGQSFNVSLYDMPDDGGPASKGASATAIRGVWAIHIDVVTTDDEDAGIILEDLLSGLHYAN